MLIHKYAFEPEVSLTELDVLSTLQPCGYAAEYENATTADVVPRTSERTKRATADHMWTARKSQMKYVALAMCAGGATGKMQTPGE